MEFSGITHFLKIILKQSLMYPNFVGDIRIRINEYAVKQPAGEKYYCCFTSLIFPAKP